MLSFFFLLSSRRPCQGSRSPGPPTPSRPPHPLKEYRESIYSCQWWGSSEPLRPPPGQCWIHPLHTWNHPCLQQWRPLYGCIEWHRSTWSTKFDIVSIINTHWQTSVTGYSIQTTLGTANLQVWTCLSILQILLSMEMTLTWNCINSSVLKC